MAPTMGLNNNNGNGQNGGDSPLSKTYQYRKIMKPMLERKRRARINRCLDELKELITGALQNVSLNCEGVCCEMPTRCWLSSRSIFDESVLKTK